MPTPVSEGLLLIRADVNAARAWASRGLAAVHVQPLGSWTAIQLADATARSAPPYDDGLGALAARPVGARLRPAVGFFAAHGVATITARGHGWRDLQRWVMWTPTARLHHPEHFPPLRPGDLAGISGGVASAKQIERALHAGAPDAVSWLAAVHQVLQLPGAGLLTGGPAADAELVEPTAKTIASFDGLVAEEHAHQRDLGEA